MNQKLLAAERLLRLPHGQAMLAVAAVIFALWGLYRGLTYHLNR
jgi:hypothetical protein